MQSILRTRSLIAVALAGVLLTGLAACGCNDCDDWRGYGPFTGNVFVDNLTDVFPPAELALTFRLRNFGAPFTGNLLSGPLPAGSTEFVGTFAEDFYDAEADMELGDLVQWFDVFVGDGQDVFFEIGD